MPEERAAMVDCLLSIGLLPFQVRRVVHWNSSFAMILWYAAWDKRNNLTEGEDSPNHIVIGISESAWKSMCRLLVYMIITMADPAFLRLDMPRYCLFLGSNRCSPLMNDTVSSFLFQAGFSSLDMHLLNLSQHVHDYDSLILLCLHSISGTNPRMVPQSADPESNSCCQQGVLCLVSPLRLYSRTKIYWIGRPTWWLLLWGSDLTNACFLLQIAWFWSVWMRKLL